MEAKKVLRNKPAICTEPSSPNRMFPAFTSLWSNIERTYLGHCSVSLATVKSRESFSVQYTFVSIITDTLKYV